MRPQPRYCHGPLRAGPEQPPSPQRGRPRQNAGHRGLALAAAGFNNGGLGSSETFLLGDGPGERQLRPPSCEAGGGSGWSPQPAGR